MFFFPSKDSTNKEPIQGRHQTILCCMGKFQWGYGNSFSFMMKIPLEIEVAPPNKLLTQHTLITLLTNLTLLTLHTLLHRLLFLQYIDCLHRSLSLHWIHFLHRLLCLQCLHCIYCLLCLHRFHCLHRLHCLHCFHCSSLKLYVE